MLSLLVDRLENLLLIVSEAIFLYLLENSRILRKNLLMQEFLSQSKALHILRRGHHVYELTFALVYYIVITDNLTTTLLLGDGKLIFQKAIGYEAEADANDTFGDEVHFQDLFFFIVDDLVLFSRLKLAWHEAKGTVI